MKNMGFGMMRLPLLDENDLSSVDIEQVKKMADVYMEHGFNYFDTGYHYHNGQSEIALREAIVKRFPRESIVIADKLPVYFITQEEQLEPIFADQMERLGIDYFDYYMLHNVSGYSEAGWKGVDSFSFAIEKKKEGKIKKLGLSTHANADGLAEILAEHHEDMEFIQLQINYLDWENEGVQARECVELAHKYDLPIIVMEPLKGGFLADVPKEAEEKMRQYNPEESPVSWALRYVAGIDGVFMVLSGASSLEQMEENIRFMDDYKPLNEEEHEILENVVEIINSNIAISCTKCNYCVKSCPANINIPKLFDLYNNEAIQGLDIPFTAIGNAYVNYSKLDGVGIASDCTECETCIAECPQHLDIPTHLKTVADHFETEGYGFNNE